MGYFSNGSEGDSYQRKYCEACVNFKDEGLGDTCAIWDLHLFGGKDFQQAKDYFIPMDSGYNQQCKMFTPKGVKE